VAAERHAEVGMGRIDNRPACKHSAPACTTGVVRIMNPESTNRKAVVMDVTRGRRRGRRPMTAECLTKMRVCRISNLRAEHHVSQRRIRARRIVREVNPETTGRQVVDMVGHSKTNFGAVAHFPKRLRFACG
jgi:hypothetical protein